MATATRIFDEPYAPLSSFLSSQITAGFVVAGSLSNKLRPSNCQSHGPRLPAQLLFPGRRRSTGTKATTKKSFIGSDRNLMLFYVVKIAPAQPPLRELASHCSFTFEMDPAIAPLILTTAFGSLPGGGTVVPADQVAIAPQSQAAVAEDQAVFNVEDNDAVNLAHDSSD
ncbi:hypothetical protein K461DRAFT_270657 [Myriangium duriaei CBS 260.36]|uniref:Uncharacterized protein n=1 Tax=Myriangium duriaei CBS 260.36 TaxID=1168546 RepID=A0A9P4J0H4_9PEZI|nr:hypothetical protein K461DRAFT_270657 [Myriangium duriaei CBS 260.36]